MSEETTAVAVAGELTAFQVKFLQELAHNGDVGKTCEIMDVDRRTFRRYLKDPAFSAKFDDIFNSEDIQNTKRELDMAATGVPKVYEDALNAHRGEEVTVICEECDHVNVATVYVADHKLRMKAAETLLKTSGLLKDTKRIEGGLTNTNVKVELTGAEMLALQRLQMGLPVPPHVYDGLKGKVPDLPPMPESKNTILQGEFREVENNE